jgi:glycine cleavage system H lipoate-binding protein
MIFVFLWFHVAVLDGLKYTKSHEWVKHEGSVATVGITDHAQVIIIYFIPSLNLYTKSCHVHAKLC